MPSVPSVSERQELDFAPAPVLSSGECMFRPRDDVILGVG